MYSIYNAVQKWAGVTLSAVMLTTGNVSAGESPISHRDITYTVAESDTIKPKKKDKLVGRAVLDAATFAPGPTSGTRLGNVPVNGQVVPFVDKQPVQGFSAILKNDDGTFMVMSDNGFGSLENSADYHLRVYTINPRFETKKGGKGDIVVKNYIELQDPDKKIPFAITNHFTKKRILTGADFDVESMQRTQDGTLWFGDEFGPFLLHTDAYGKVLEAPIPLPDYDNSGKEIRSPQNPFNEESSAVRIMNAVKTHAAMYGNIKVPVFSPWYPMIDDANPNTFSPDRNAPPASSGLATASSEIFNVNSLRNAGFSTIAWTVNDEESMKALLKLGVNGIISDSPDLLRTVVEKYDGNNDSKPDFLDADGLIDIKLFDAQGHRGGRNLRPENTLPAMESALDNLMTTLETDAGITKDGIPVLDHDPHIEAAKVRRADGQPYEFATEVLVKDYTLAQIQSTFIADKLLAGRPNQTNDRLLSPVAVAFAQQKGLIDPYVMPSVQQLFDFVKFYVTYYKSGAGSSGADALKRWKNAERVRFNIETKINPRQDTDAKGDVFADRTVAPLPFAKAVADVIVANSFQDRADIQSFDFRTLLIVQEKYPQIRTGYLFGDFPKVGNVSDGTNLQDENGANTPWLAGLYWPYRSTVLSNSFRARQSGGFEGMALNIWDNKLLPLLEQTLVNGEPKTLLIHEFDLATKQYNGKRHKYLLEPKASAIGDFVIFNPKRGLVIERDGSQGDLNGFKTIYEIELKEEGLPVGKRLAVDLLNIADPDKISEPGQEGDVGIGETFAFPFTTIEDVVVFDDKRIGVLNDNNYPFSIGRHVGKGLPDDNEFIIIKLDRKLGTGKIEGYSGLTLVDADTDTDISLLKDGDVIELPQLPTQHLNIRADFPDQNVGSVVFDFNDKKNFRIENVYPYALGSDDAGDYKSVSLPAGIHTIVATPYSLPAGQGVAGKPVKVTFTLEIGAVISFTLVNADTDTDIRILQNGEQLDLGKLATKNLNIRANAPSAYIESVSFEWNSQLLRTESVAPYTLAGDPNLDYQSWTPAIGDYILKATPYAKNAGSGVAGKPLTLSFKVVDSSVPAAASSITTQSIRMYPNPIEDVVTIQFGNHSGETVHVSIIDGYGQSLYSAEKALQSEGEELTLNVSKLKLRKGLFFIRVTSPATKPQLYRLYKK